MASVNTVSTTKTIPTAVKRKPIVRNVKYNNFNHCPTPVPQSNKNPFFPINNEPSEEAKRN